MTGQQITPMEKEKKEQVFALCIENKDSEDLEKRKIYTVIPDEKAELKAPSLFTVAIEPLLIGSSPARSTGWR